MPRIKTIKYRSVEEMNIKLQSTNTPELSNEIFNAIKRGIKNNNKLVTVCNIELEEDDEVIKLQSSKEDWKTALDGCMNNFLKTEEYEKCSEIKQILESYEFEKMDK